MINEKRQSGVTLTEMTIVISIAALMIALAVPTTNMLLNSFESESGAKSIINAALASARAIAAKEQRYAGIRFQKIYDPDNPIHSSQYIVFIIYDYDKTGLENGFRAADGIQPIKLPDSIAVTDMLYEPNNVTPRGDGYLNSETEIKNTQLITDATTFSIVFSPSGKLISHEVRIRNRDGYTATSSSNYSNDDIFNRISQIQAGIGMFLQDDYYADYTGSSVTNLGIGPEFSRNYFYIYETKKYKDACSINSPWTGYLSKIKPVYINPYTGTIINQK